MIKNKEYIIIAAVLMITVPVANAASPFLDALDLDYGGAIAEFLQIESDIVDLQGNQTQIKADILDLQSDMTHTHDKAHDMQTQIDTMPDVYPLRMESTNFGITSSTSFGVGTMAGVSGTVTEFDYYFDSVSTIPSTVVTATLYKNGSPTSVNCTVTVSTPEKVNCSSSTTVSVTDTDILNVVDSQTVFNQISGVRMAAITITPS